MSTTLVFPKSAKLSKLVHGVGLLAGGPSQKVAMLRSICEKSTLTCIRTSSVFRSLVPSSSTAPVWSALEIHEVRLIIVKVFKF